jgi:hypothetical protein
MLRPVRSVGVVGRTMKEDLIQPVDPLVKLTQHLPRKLPREKPAQNELVGKNNGKRKRPTIKKSRGIWV